MTMKIGNKSLNRLFRKADAVAKHLGKIKKNCAPKLNRIGHLFTLDKACLKPGPLSLTLVYTGPEDAVLKMKAMKRLQEVLDVVFDTEGKAIVKFSRITVPVQITGMLVPNTVAA